MGKMEQLFLTIRRKFSAKKEEVTQPISCPKFDKKYKVVVEYNSGQFEYDDDMITWLDQNSSGSVDIQYSAICRRHYVAFENTDDALFFKIRFSS